MHAVTAIHHLQQENVHTHVSIYQRRQTRNDLHNSERNKVHQAKEEEQIYARARDAGRERAKVVALLYHFLCESNILSGARIQHEVVQ